MLILSLPFSGHIPPLPSLPFDLVEYRLDFQEAVDPAPFLTLDYPYLCTLRDTKEGGVTDWQRDRKIQTYQQLLHNEYCMVDDELVHYQEKTPEIPAERLVLSWHCFDHDQAYCQLTSIVEQSNRVPSRFLKLALPVESYRDLALCEEAVALSHKPVLLAGLGELGVLSRLLFHHLGAVGTYFGMHQTTTAPGQLTEIEVERYHLASYSSATLLGGVIGGRQIKSSLGLTHYNNVFYESRLDAAYLPFYVGNWNDFWQWFVCFEKAHPFYGFSVTMPHKYHVSEQVMGKHQPMNCFLPHLRSQLKGFPLVNTDRIALVKALAYLEVSALNKILVLGSGAMAELCLQVLQSHPDVTLMARNPISSGHLSRAYGRNCVKHDFSAFGLYDILINCTPVGMVESDDIPIPDSISFRKAIDLTRAETPNALITHCQENGKPYVDGKQFWIWQSEKQEELFKEMIAKIQVDRKRVVGEIPEARER